MARPRPQAANTPRGYGEQQGQGQGDTGKEHGRRQALRQQVRHRALVDKGLSQVQAHQTSEVIQVLATQGAVQAQGRGHGGAVRRASALPQHRLHRVSGHQVDEQKDQGADPQHHQDRSPEATDQGVKQGRPAPLGVTALPDLHQGPIGNLVKQLDQVGVAHADTAVGARHTHGFGIRAAVDIDESAQRVLVATPIPPGLQPRQPEDSGEYPVALRKPGGEIRTIDLPRGPPPDKDRPHRTAGTDTQPHPMHATRGTAAVPGLPGTGQPSGDRVAAQRDPCL